MRLLRLLLDVLPMVGIVTLFATAAVVPQATLYVVAGCCAYFVLLFVADLVAERRQRQLRAAPPDPRLYELRAQIQRAVQQQRQEEN